MKTKTANNGVVVPAGMRSVTKPINRTKELIDRIQKHWDAGEFNKAFDCTQYALQELGKVEDITNMRVDFEYWENN